ncbi:MAG TPA: GNAT family N-acetyltransferase [Verrucomicrobiae bacterium]|nr:GNAT family N-acetyltransferase [Verrucomicrobiae bacterium]
MSAAGADTDAMTTTDRPTLRGMIAADRAPIERILKATGVFFDDEVAVALELFDIARDRRGQTDYIFLCADVGGRLAGYACYGPVPMTDRTFDLYWIAVDPNLHGRGVGRALLDAMEGDLKARGARKVFIETGGRDAYAPTRRFYEATGYTVAARLPGFYREGDDKYVFMKDLS